MERNHSNSPVSGSFWSKCLCCGRKALRAGEQKGVALLAVLWLTVALGFMAMATAHLVRTEVAAVSNQIEWQRGYYLARGGIETAVYTIARSAWAQPSGPKASGQLPEFLPGKRWLQYEFPGGSCTVEIVPENAKLNINQAPPEQLAALFVSLGMSADESLQLAAAIVDWRSPRTSDVGSLQDAFYAGLPQPYLARHAQFDQLEELLPVRGMSRSLFFGRTEHSPEGRWQKWSALADLLTTQASANSVNPNYAPYEILRVLPGWNDAMAAAAIAARKVAPFQSMDELQAAVPGASTVAGLAPLTLAQGPVYTLTATGYLPGSGVRRSVRALVLIRADLPLYNRVLGWWDDWPQQAAPMEAQRTGGSDVGTGSGNHT